MIDAVIIDDEPHCIRYLSHLIHARLGNRVRLVGSFDNIHAGVDGIRAHSPRLVFLDVQLGDHTGFDLLRQVDTMGLAIIFTTAYDRYAVQAFRFSAVDYLLKPVNGDDLEESIGKVAARTGSTGPDARYTLLAQQLYGPPSGRKIALPSPEGWDYVPVADITWCQAEGNYTLFHLTGRKPVLVSQTLKTYDELLDGCGFFRVHHGSLVNLSRVVRYLRIGVAVMDDGSSVDVSTRRREAFVKAMNVLKAER